ncbi:hypothetical protein B0H13DRAFT_2341742 [Mycena leptocephala]|nr:hypothetical protein B0H13DRAFT_2341742 [Mycena leptocephala]
MAHGAQYAIVLCASIKVPQHSPDPPHLLACSWIPGALTVLHAPQAAEASHTACPRRRTLAQSLSELPPPVNTLRTSKLPDSPLPREPPQDSRHAQRPFDVIVSESFSLTISICAGYDARDRKILFPSHRALSLPRADWILGGPCPSTLIQSHSPLVPRSADIRGGAHQDLSKLYVHLRLSPRTGKRTLCHRCALAFGQSES